MQNNNISEPLVFVVYDGIDNSIFDGQVLQPLIKHKIQHPQQPIILITFEKKFLSHEQLKKRMPSQIDSYICLKKLPFLGMWSLYPATKQLKQFLNTIPTYFLSARGPLAGFISFHAGKAAHCKKLTVQVRGLLTQEYAYAHAHETTILKKWWHAWRQQRCAALETTLYQQKNSALPITFEAVSEALKDYLQKHYQTQPEKIILAQHDIPAAIAPEKIQEWRGATRTQLEIPSDTKVYCYNGSIKPWQCPEKTIQHFKEELQKNSNSFLLILTHDTIPFEHLMQQANIPAHCYKIMTVPHIDIYHYLAACDAGIIFREQHPINWTSRPTKILEYQAVGLPIIHNNTIAMLSEKT